MLPEGWPSYWHCASHVATIWFTANSGVYDLDPIPHLSTNADIRLDAASARSLSPMMGANVETTSSGDGDDGDDEERDAR